MTEYYTENESPKRFPNPTISRKKSVFPAQSVNPMLEEDGEKEEGEVEPDAEEGRDGGEVFLPSTDEVTKNNDSTKSCNTYVKARLEPILVVVQYFHSMKPSDDFVLSLVLFWVPNLATVSGSRRTHASRV